MKLQEIKDAVLSGKKVHHQSNIYDVIQSDYTKDFLICCSSNKSCIGLTWQDGKTMNGKEQDFYIEV